MENMAEEATSLPPPEAKLHQEPEPDPEPEPEPEEETPEPAAESNGLSNSVKLSDNNHDKNIVSEMELKTGEKEAEQEEGVKEPYSILASSDLSREKHISIQRQLIDLEKLAYLSEGDSASAMSSSNTDQLDSGLQELETKQN